MIRNSLMVALLAFFFSCSPQQKEEKISSENSDTEIEKVVEEIDLEGLYYPSHIISCLNNELIPVSGNLKSLDSAYSSILPKAYHGQTIFAQVKGTLTRTGEHVELIVKQVVKAEQKYDRNTCIAYDYWCRGNEPFWQVQISEKEDLIDFFDPMAAKYYHFVYVKPDSQGTTTIYEVEDSGTNNKIKISITKEKCSDGMSERDYSHKAEVILNGKAYKGCAVNFSTRNS